MDGASRMGRQESYWLLSTRINGVTTLLQYVKIHQIQGLPSCSHQRAWMSSNFLENSVATRANHAIAPVSQYRARLCVSKRTVRPVTMHRSYQFFKHIRHFRKLLKGNMTRAEFAQKSAPTPPRFVMIRMNRKLSIELESPPQTRHGRVWYRVGVPFWRALALRNLPAHSGRPFP
jgi:hypothetical protein